MASLRLSRRALLQHRAVTFCNAFTSPHLDPSQLLADHFVPDDPQITEHGPAFARTRLPFLGQTFSGHDGCLEYFRLLGQVLAIELDSSSFPGDEGFAVDEFADVGGRGRGVVTVVAKGTFRSKKTGNAWQEQFVHRLSGFDDSGRIGHWEIWADPLSAWEAVGP